MITTTSTRSLLATIPLFIIILIDGMGLGIFFPVLNAIILEPSSSILNPSVSAEWRNIAYSVTNGVFMLCWFFGAAILGDLSDQVGRKKPLLICLIGAFAGYSLSVFAVSWHSYSLLLAGRIIAGFTAGSQPIAQAAIIDISLPEYKARNIGFILAAVSVGFILGPLFGGMLSNNHIVSWFSYSTPLYFSAIVSFINAILLFALFNETRPSMSKIKPRLTRAFQLFAEAFNNKKIRRLSIAFLFMELGWGSFFFAINIFLYQKLNFSPTLIGLYLALLGAGFGIGCGVLVHYFTKRFVLKNTVIITCLLTAIAIALVVIIPVTTTVWLCALPAAIAIALAYTTLVNLFSNQVSADEQGWVMGIMGSVMALAFSMTGLVAGALANLGVEVPLIAAVVCLIAAAGVLCNARAI